VDSRNNGIIDKYIGDGIMAFWGPPFTGTDDHSGPACLAALDQLAGLAGFRAELPEITGLRRGFPEVDIRFVRQPGGQARIYTEGGRGTMICLYFPRYYARTADRDVEDAPVAMPVAEGNQIVLVVDDEPTIRVLIAEVLLHADRGRGRARRAQDSSNQCSG
jgi:hypothetical protein